MGYTASFNSFQSCLGCDKRTKGFFPCGACMARLPRDLRANPLSGEALGYLRDRARGFVSPGAPLVWAAFEREPECDRGWVQITPAFRSYREAVNEAATYGVDTINDRWYKVAKTEEV